ncbi:hypothetical protein EMPS_02952 [Entomortierella parvispora]|uniref:PX domain-containing protein n=1 Tax=Entomortierella parvispora TaxID=205924 RepID=A0A9P3H6E1_9FUNG|nr:hypothetical protein EMPS_02952 [Entomortierella parvispora]
MSHDFSDPLTSNAYASCKGIAGHDPLLVPSNNAGAQDSFVHSTDTGAVTTPIAAPTCPNNRLAHSGRETAVSSAVSRQQQQRQQQQHKLYDPLSYSPQQSRDTSSLPPNLRGINPNLVKNRSTPAPAVATGNKASAVPQTPANAASTQIIKRKSTPLKPSRSATTRAGYMLPFADPLAFDSSSVNATLVHDDAGLLTSGTLVNGHGAVASASSGKTSGPQRYGTTDSHSHNDRGSNNSDFRKTVSTSPPLSPSFDPSSQRAERERSLRHESSYDQQRVKAPQYLHITIPDTNRRGKDGMFILSVQTNLPRYKRQSYANVTRSYLEFARLREHLVAEHPETIVPVLPPERSLNNAADLQSMRIFLERISRHPILSQDYELQMFIESEFGFLPPVRSKTILGGFLNIGVKRFSSGGGVSSGSALSLGDTDDEFEEERASALKTETKLQAVIKNLDKEIKARRDFSSKEAELSTFSNTWAAGESLPELARVFKALAKPLDGMAKASKAQVGGDATVLGGFLDYKLQHVQTLGHALDYRLSVLGECDAAIKSTESKRKTMERLRSSTNINPEKVTDSIDDLEDAMLFEGNMKQRLEQVSMALNKDLEAYRLQSQEDLLRALREYSQRQVRFERAKLEELQAVSGAIGEAEEVLTA